MDRAVAEFELSGERISELKRWHGTDESDLPPASTLQNLSRDTIAALTELTHLVENELSSIGTRLVGAYRRAAAAWSSAVSRYATTIHAVAPAWVSSVGS